MTTLPKRGLKTSQYKINMNKKDLKRLSKSELIKMLLKKVHNHEDLLDNNPFKDEVVQREPEKCIKPKETIDSKTGKCVSIYKMTFFNGRAKPLLSLMI